MYIPRPMSCGILLNAKDCGAVSGATDTVLSSRHSCARRVRTPGPTYTACCVTGQMRGYHISRLNWQRSTELRFLLGAAEHVDWFLVTSNTTSYQWYQQRVASQGSGFVETHVSTGCQRFVKADAPWIWRDAGTALEFNLNRFPFIHGNLHATLLVQHWQLAKCREMMQRREQALGVQVQPCRKDTHRCHLGDYGHRSSAAESAEWACRASETRRFNSTEALPSWLRKLHTTAANTGRWSTTG